MTSWIQTITGIAVLLAPTAVLSAATINVPTDFATIQQAIDNAAPNDEVVIAAGVYTGVGNRGIDFQGKSITVRGATGDPADVVIDAEQADRCALLSQNEPTSTRLEAVTLRNGLNQVGRTAGGILIVGSPTIVDCVIESCTVQDLVAGVQALGGGATVQGGAPSFVRCTFSVCSADFGGAVLVLGTAAPSFTLCTFVGNDAVVAGGAIAVSGDNAAPTVVNCVLRTNTAGRGGAIWGGDEANLLIQSCSFTENVADQHGAVSVDSGFGLIVNSILWNDSPEEIGGGGLALVSSSNVQGGVPGFGNIDADPRYVDPSNGDLSLQIDSPCIDAGDSNSVPPSVVTDYLGNPRLDDVHIAVDTGIGDPVVDMGAYELPDPGLPSSTLVAVPTDCPTIQLGIDIVAEGGEVVVAPGRYTERIDLAGKSITVRGAAGAAATILDASGDGPVVQIVGGETARIEGLTLTDGTDGILVDNGSAPLIIDCSIEFNQGAGVRAIGGSQPTIERCLIQSNDSDTRGGGVLADAGAQVTVLNTVFHDNTAEQGGGGAAVLGAGSSLTIIHCTIAQSLNAGLYIAGTPDVPTFRMENSIVWNNLGGSLITEPGAVVDVVYSNIKDGATGVGNISLLPRFRSLTTPDYRLGNNSPSIDSGDVGLTNAAGLTVDLDGNPREVDDGIVLDTGIGTVDMGAYERQEDSIVCPQDLDGSEVIGFGDLTIILAQWGPCPGCEGDLDGDGEVGFPDLTQILLLWGACPLPPK